MLLVSDHNVRGTVNALRLVIERELADEAAILDLRFVQLEDLGLPADATDAQIYARCLEIEAILITGDRSTRDGAESLENVINRLSRDDSFPVITIGDPPRLLRDPDYASGCAIRLIDCLDRIEGLRGTRRYFLSCSSPTSGR